MKHTIKITTRENWLAVAAKCPHATYFHTPYWYDVVVPNGDYTAVEVVFEDGASAVIPMAKTKRLGGLVVNHVSSFFSNYGGWVSADPLREEHTQILTNVLLSKKNVAWRINPFDETLTTLPSSSAFKNVRIIDDFTHIIDLTKSEEQRHSELRSGHRNGINRAIRGGITIRPAETIDEWKQYYEIYLGAVSRWRAGGKEMRPRHVYPWKLFQKFYENRSGNEILWLAMKDGFPVAGVLHFYWNRHVVAWNGAADFKYSDDKPNNLLYWEVFRDAAKRGYEIFDFNPSGGYSGVEAFKSHFGAVKVSSPLVVARSPLRAVVSRLRGLS